MIPLAEVTSSSIRAIGWAQGKGMQVVFHNSPDKLYCYPGVSEFRTRKLIDSPSIGKAFVAFRSEPHATLDWDGILSPKPVIIDWYSVWLQTLHA